MFSLPTRLCKLGHQSGGHPLSLSLKSSLSWLLVRKVPENQCIWAEGPRAPGRDSLLATFLKTGGQPPSELNSCGDKMGPEATCGSLGT